MIFVSLNSKHLLSARYDTAEEIVWRINLAYTKDLKHLKKRLNLLKDEQCGICIDYPSGRIKPPNKCYPLQYWMPVIVREPKIKYVAVSNVETPFTIERISPVIPNHIKILPKIETELGIENLRDIIKVTNCNEIMLDKNDLWCNVGQDPAMMDDAMERLFITARQMRTKVWEEAGVIFARRKR